MQSTKGQRMAIGIIITRLQLDKETKELMVLNYSNGRTNTTKELTYAEADLMIRNLNREISYEGSPGDKMRNKILSLGHEMYWQKKGRKIDMDRINGWCVKYGYLHKPLDDYTDNELPELVTQFEKVYKDFLKGI